MAFMMTIARDSPTNVRNGSNLMLWIHIDSNNVFFPRSQSESQCLKLHTWLLFMRMCSTHKAKFFFQTHFNCILHTNRRNFYPFALKSWCYRQKSQNIIIWIGVELERITEWFKFNKITARSWWYTQVFHSST